MTPIAAEVWLVDMRQVDAGQRELMRGWLTEAEARRHQRFGRARRRDQFVIGHGLLRLALARLLARPVAAIGLRERAGLAPQLLLDGATVSLPGFSLSHSGDWIACAVSAQTALGLDIELLDARRDLPALAAQSFNAAEVAALQALPAHARLAGFYRLWSHHEASFKLDQGAPLEPAPACLSLAHASVSMVLCSAQPLAAAPLLHLPVSLAELIHSCP